MLRDLVSVRVHDGALSECSEILLRFEREV
jgi:hypothetical protein